MSDVPPGASRRDLLTGRALLQQVDAIGAEFADGLLDRDSAPPAPAGRETVRLETRAMACPWAVVMNPGPPRQVMAASDALDIVHRLEAQLTTYRDDSEVMRLNREAADQPMPVEAGLFELLRQCLHWFESTNGAFDPTAGPLIALWREKRDQGSIPTDRELQQALSCVGMHRVELDLTRQTVRWPVAGYRLDLGGVGKGYAIDRAADHLRREGVDNFLIHGGHSSLYAAGDHAGQGGWPVGLKNPLFTNERYATLLLTNCGLSTSGSNIQFFRHQGQRYGHLLDPRTGWPTHSPDVTAEQETDTSSASQPLLSVTVLAPTAAEADALSTAFYVMGLENARDYCHNHPEVSAILVPTPSGGRTLKPLVCNLPEQRLFVEPSVAAASVMSTRGDAARSRSVDDQPRTDHS